MRLQVGIRSAIVGSLSLLLLNGVQTLPAAEKAAAEKAAAEKSPAAKFGSEQEAEAAIGKALASKVSLNFKETPLADVVAHLRKTQGINVQLDTKCLEESGIDSATAI